MKKYQAFTLLAAASLVLAGCGPVRLVASTNIPQPLVVKMPVGVALFMPQSFSQYVHREERWSTDWHVDLGPAQTEGMMRLFDAMFERVARVDSVNAGAQTGAIAAILEPSIEEYAFVTPRDAGSPFFAVSIKYRVNVYLPDGKLADSWGFTGYGTAPAQGLSSTGPLAAATALAMRDAGAKLAVEFREQPVMRGLLPDAPTPDGLPAAPIPPAPAPDVEKFKESETPAVVPPAPSAQSGVASQDEAAGESGEAAQPENAGPSTPPQNATEPPAPLIEDRELDVEGFSHS